MQVLGRGEPELDRKTAAGAVGKVAERSGVHEGRRALGGLNQVRFERVPQERGHRARSVEVGGMNGRSVGRQRRDDAAEPGLQVRVVPGQREDDHHFGRGGDDERALMLHEPGVVALPDEDPSEGPVLHVQRPRPEDPVRVDLERVPVEDVVVEEGREEIVRGGDGVDVAGEAEVDFRGRLDGRPAAARRASLHAEDRPERRLAEAGDGRAVQPREPVGETDRRDGLPFPVLGRGHPRDEDQFPGRLLRRALAYGRHRDLADPPSGRMHLVGPKSKGRCQVVDAPHPRSRIPRPRPGSEGQNARSRDALYRRPLVNPA